MEQVINASKGLTFIKETNVVVPIRVDDVIVGEMGYQDLVNYILTKSPLVANLVIEDIDNAFENNTLDHFLNILLVDIYWTKIKSKK